MKRLHLFEFEDQPWFPAFVRDYMTDYLQHVASMAKMFAPAVPLLEKALKASGQNRIIDLASGGGGTWKTLAPDLAKEVDGFRVKLTDLYPNIPAFKAASAARPSIIEMETEPISATQVPERLAGMRTMFLSFHHFRPEEAMSILQDAVNQGQPIGIFEGQARDIPHLVRFAFSPLFVLLLTPMVRPFSLGRLLFTYLIPLVPLFVLWDGLVSVLRTYSTDELEGMIRQVEGGSAYAWQVGQVVQNGVTMPYVVGIPSGQ